MRILNLSVMLIMILLVSCTQMKKENNDGLGIKNGSAVYDYEQLIAMLDIIWKTEQGPIRLRDSLGKIHGYESVEFQEQNEVYHKNHDINEKKIVELLDSIGWPGESNIGEQGNLTICNVPRMKESIFE